MLILLTTALLAITPPTEVEQDDGGGVDLSDEIVSRDGGDVPVVSKTLKERWAPVLAPELVQDGGTAPLEAPASLSVYNVDLPVEATITAASFGLYAVVDLLIKPTLEGDLSCRRPVGNGRCNPADLTAFDRYAVGRSSDQWQAFGDVALAISIAMPVIYLALESLALPTTTPVADFATDVLVVGEAMALTSAMQTVMKFAFRRPRPIRYQDVNTPLSSFDQELSFPSGHTSLVAAASTAITTTIFLRHPRSKVRFAVLGAGMLLTGLTAFSRVQAGQHFPTDVIVGVLIGGFAGFTVPYLHRKDSPLNPIVGFDPSTGSGTVGVSGTF